MELLFVVLGGAILGILAHVALPASDTRGVVLAPAFGAGVAAVVWEVLTWLGWPADGGWIWVASMVIPAIVCVIVCRRAASVRRRRDTELFDRLVAS